MRYVVELQPGEFPEVMTNAQTWYQDKTFHPESACGSGSGRMIWKQPSLG